MNREQREGHEQGGLLGTLRLNSMNREQRERREHGEANQYKLSQVLRNHRW